MQGHQLASGPADLRVGKVVFVEGLKDNHLIARDCECEERGHHRLRCAAGYGDLSLGVGADTVVVRRFIRNRLP